MKLDQEQLKDLEEFVDACQKNPEILYLDELSFFRQYLQSLGANIPPKSKPASNEGAKESTAASNEEKAKEKVEMEDTEEESDLDIDMEGVVEPDTDDPLPMGDETKEVTEEEMDKADEMRCEAMRSISDGNYEKAVEIFGEAIEMNPMSAALYAKRANCLLRMNKPNACIRDCNRAIKMNPDNAQAYKFRGRANRFLGKWEDAACDLATACKIDYDEQANEWLKEVQPNAKKIQDHKRKYERLQQEKKIREQQNLLRKRRDEHEKAAAEEKAKSSDGMPGGMPSGMPGGMPGGMPSGMPDLSFLLSDPEIVQALQDPETAEAFKDISTNPANIKNYENNPKVTSILAKMAQKMSGPGGAFGGGFPGGFPGFTS